MGAKLTRDELVMVNFVCPLGWAYGAYSLNVSMRVFLDELQLK